MRVPIYLYMPLFIFRGSHGILYVFRESDNAEGSAGERFAVQFRLKKKLSGLKPRGGARE